MGGHRQAVRLCNFLGGIGAGATASPSLEEVIAIESEACALIITLVSSRFGALFTTCSVVQHSREDGPAVYGTLEAAPGSQHSQMPVASGRGRSVEAAVH
jgi:hypothetical protein